MLLRQGQARAPDRYRRIREWLDCRRARLLSLRQTSRSIVVQCTSATSAPSQSAGGLVLRHVDRTALSPRSVSTMGLWIQFDSESDLAASLFSSQRIPVPKSLFALPSLCGLSILGFSHSGAIFVCQIE